MDFDLLSFALGWCTSALFSIIIVNIIMRH